MPLQIVSNALARGLAGGLLLAFVTGAVDPAGAHAERRQSYQATFTSEHPGSPTGLRQRVGYRNRRDRKGKPYAVARIEFVLPRGSKIDTSVPPQCHASDAEFELRGEDACPSDTKVGAGRLGLDFGAQSGGFPRVVKNDVTFFNDDDELILFSESTNTPGPPVRNASRIEVREHAFVSSVPPLPASPPPDPFVAIRTVFNRLDEVTRGHGGDKRAYITTPSTCPGSGTWTIKAVFTYRDGEVQTEQSKTRCAR